MAYDPLTAAQQQQGFDETQSQRRANPSGLQGEILGQVMSALGIKTLAEKQNEAQRNRESIMKQRDLGLLDLKDPEVDAQAKKNLTVEEYTGLKKYVGSPEYAAKKQQLDDLRTLTTGVSQLFNYGSLEQIKAANEGTGGNPTVDTTRQLTPEQKVQNYTAFSPRLVQVMAGTDAGKLALDTVQEAHTNANQKDQLAISRQANAIASSRLDVEKKTAIMQGFGVLVSAGPMSHADGSQVTIAEKKGFVERMMNGQPLTSSDQDILDFKGTFGGGGGMSAYQKLGFADAAAATAAEKEAQDKYTSFAKQQAGKSALQGEDLKSQVDAIQQTQIDAALAHSIAYMQAQGIDTAKIDPKALVGVAFNRVMERMQFVPEKPGLVWGKSRGDKLISGVDLMQKDPEQYQQVQQAVAQRIMQRAAGLGFAVPGGQSNAEDEANAFLSKAVPGLSPGGAPQPPPGTVNKPANEGFSARMGRQISGQLTEKELTPDLIKERNRAVNASGVQPAPQGKKLTAYGQAKQRRSEENTQEQANPPEPGKKYTVVR